MKNSHSVRELGVAETWNRRSGDKEGESKRKRKDLRNKRRGKECTKPDEI